jgi:hypothetical protein
MSICVYFKMSDGRFTVVTQDLIAKVVHELNKEMHNIEIYKGYKKTEKGLMDYLQDILIWNEQLRTHHKMVTKCFNLFDLGSISMPLSIINLRRTASKLLGMFEEIDKDEIFYLETTRNSGTTYINPNKNDGEYIWKLWSYDYKGFYPECLCMIEIPLRKGRKIKYEKIPKKIPFGFYHAEIIITNENAKKIFSNNCNNIYTNYSIEFARKLKKEFGGVKIKLNKTIENNAYIYDEKDLISGGAIFETWYNQIEEWKNAYPENKLVKIISTDVWGQLSARRMYKITDDDPKFLESSRGKDTKYRIHKEIHKNGKILYCIYERLNPYWNYIARIKSFITSFSSARLGEVLMKKDLTKLIRIQTDGVSFTTPQEFDHNDENEKNLILDTKLTGVIKFSTTIKGNPNSNSYINISTGFETQDHIEPENFL